MSRGGGRLTELSYAACWRLVRLLPEPVARGVFTAGADLTVRRGGRGPGQLARNLRRVVGDLPDAEFTRLVRDAMRSYSRYWMEAFRLPQVSRERLRDTFHMTTPELFERAAAGGAVFALPHSANWEHAGAWVATRGLPLVAVAQRLKPEGLYRRFLAYREALGMEIVAHSGGERPPMDVLAERLSQGALIALLADRDMSARGVPVTFFGHPAKMPAGPALLALRTGKPLFAVSLWYGPDGTYCRMDGPLTTDVDGPLTDRVADLTQRMADSFAAGIAEHPVDWHMLSRLWLDDPAAPATDGPGRAPARTAPGGD